MAKPASVSNQYDKTIVNSLLKKVDGFHADLESERGSYMSRCRVIRESLEGVYDEAKAAGIPTTEFKTWVKIRKNEAKTARLYNDLEPDQQANLQMIAEATEKVRDLPLWSHAAERGTHRDDDGRTVHPKPMFN